MQSKEKKAAYMREYHARNKQRKHEYQKKYYAANREKLIEAGKRYRVLNPSVHDPVKDHEYYERTKARFLERNKRNHIKVRKEVIDHYGGQCACCGETEFNFLTIDHIGNWGAEHRKQGFSGRNLYYWIRRNGYPTNLRVLCYNCNCSSGFYGTCPHKNNVYSPTPFVWSEPITFKIGASL